MIEIDIPEPQAQPARAEEELAKRRAALVQPHKSEIASPLLRRYAAGQIGRAGRYL